MLPGHIDGIFSETLGVVSLRKRTRSFEEIREANRARKEREAYEAYNEKRERRRGGRAGQGGARRGSVRQRLD